jgi:integrase
MELLALKWDDIALDRGTIHIRESKNGEPRSIPLTGVALELITELYSQHRNAGSDYIFPSRDGTKPLEIRRSWDEALRRAHIADFRFHDLRHTTASYLAMSGASLIDIAAILGHRDIKHTMRYAHLSQQHTRSILERMTSTL